jgi:hypothetical protein
MFVTVAEILDQLQSLKGLPGVSGDHVRFRMALLEAQVISLEDLEDSPLAPLPPVVPERPPLLRPVDVPFDLALALRLFRSLVGAFEKYGKGHADPARLRQMELRPQRLQAIVRRVALAADEDYRDAISRRIGVPETLIDFVARLLAAPFVVHMLSKVSPNAIAALESRRCPACDAEPGLAWLDPADGNRRLGCSLCAISWRFAGRDCPFCGYDSGSLERLEIAGESDRWIEACPFPLCRRYLKTIDLRNRAGDRPFLPLVEHTATLHLDLLAEREGYDSGGAYAALQ